MYRDGARDRGLELLMSMGDNRFDEYLLGTTNEVAGQMANGGVDSVRPLGIGSIVLAILWGFGLGSLLAVGAGVLAFMLRKRATVEPLPGLRLAAIGTALGVIGLVATVVAYA
ncbi:MAG: hypothetical protein JOZ99_09265 [Actinobacteria bacterium]|nr:hypothetical protein [Actinomycetota bacterium]